MNKIVTRFAPSPTGNLHIGSLRTALINYIVTKNAKIENPDSKFLLRIEDTDKLRSKKEHINNIIKGLKWVGINWDKEIFIQSNQIKRHQEIASVLLKKKLAFKCICTKEELDERRKDKTNLFNKKRLCFDCENNDEIQNSKKDYTVRIKIPLHDSIIIKDIVQGDIEVQNKEIDNFILLRKDGSPTYMLSVVVDDFDMNVNMIIRGDDHLNNSFRQIYIYKHMNWTIPSYAHIPLIHGEDGAKLSKRHGAVDIKEFEKKGFLKESIINNLILLGWSNNTDTEIISIEDIIKNFNIKKISKSSSIFDYKKLNFFNNHYLKLEKNINYFYKYCEENNILKEFLSKDRKKLEKIFKIYKKKLNYLQELEIISQVYFEENFKTNKNDKLTNNYNSLLKNFIISLNKLNNWSIDLIEELIQEFITKNHIKFVQFGKPTRFILSNSENGPSISDILYILGKKDSILRLNQYINEQENYGK